MGLLSEGSPLSWEETKSYADHVRKHGVKQFINQYRKLKDRQKDVLYWGDEVEYMLIRFDHEKEVVQLLLKSTELLSSLQKQNLESKANAQILWHPEYAQYMVEGTPGSPFGCLMAHLNLVEANMKLRRESIGKLLKTGERIASITAFPRVGCSNFTYPSYKPNPTPSGCSSSLFFPDEAIHSSHPRFKTLTRNVRLRRKEKVAINIPIFKDKNTMSPFLEDLSIYGDNGESQNAAKPDHIYMDAMGFGMGCCCLQLTFQACNIGEARLLYDHLAPICPIMMALSAATPIYRGYLADTDCRWSVIVQSVDDRTREERGLEPLKHDRFLINKSRYDSIDSYLSEEGRCYNDLQLVYDKEIYEELMAEGIDDLLSQHIAHLFIRDPISLFEEKINQNDSTDTDHFENIQSTNWQSLRFKPPPPGSNIGWRVEFRPMEIQLSDFENAAYVVFIVLVTRAILTFKLNLLIPISKVDENMVTAQQNNAARLGKFYFRKDILTVNSPPEAAECVGCCERIDEKYTLMTINEIINGKEDFPGLVPMVNKYLDYIECDVDTRCTVLQYLKLISKRASGELLTMAQWTRQFVTNHEDYKNDSVVSDKINYDFLMECDKIAYGEHDCPQLFFKYHSRTRDNIPAAVSKAEANLNRKIYAS
ncbi:glutamate--cysteine ligase catalytic subunit [Octopus sinensis]|uniref:Glutamate--cysteine ligase n=1 Tax=Octopus sinensis TaxID=2607531 RepID=A0A6P7SAS3_9MOLL|nr:glutamate--cysteine ligase catalytic subunit [Octopus sinensis]